MSEATIRKQRNSISNMIRSASYEWLKANRPKVAQEIKAAVYAEPGLNQPQFRRVHSNRIRDVLRAVKSKNGTRK